MATIRKGDLVQVISGTSQARGGDRGKQGEVLEVLRDENRILVQGINFVTKHVRVGQTQRGTKTGGIETVEAPIHISNVALVDPETKQPARTGVQVEEVTKDGVTKTVRTRVFKPSRRAAKPAKAEKAPKADKAEKSEKKPATKAKAAAPKKKDDE
ncbi:50S ribosomal protein L24 [Pseudoclavibacter sp. RFBA6]|nr:50S ribosomal protein L24 [Pseudoclavibacter sp. RFBA6]PPG38835.1 50S ribosomal protein L24 [Pseudoclavibacter sp. RFBA6]